MEPLIKDMTRMDPSQRPTIDQADERFETLRASLSAWTLRSQFVYRYEFAMTALRRHLVRTIDDRVWTTRTSYPFVPLPPKS